MKIFRLVTKQLPLSAFLLGASLISPLGTARALADRCDSDRTPLEIKGYQTYTNVAFIDPSNPMFLQVRTGGEGGVSHLGRMTSSSSDQTGNLVTGEMLATYTFQDDAGDRLQLSAVGASNFEPDGRVTFEGDYTVVGGTGKFRSAGGQIHFEGWARVADMVTGAGIGFVTMEGTLLGVKTRRDPAFAYESSGVGTISSDGQDFVYEGDGKATAVGKYSDLAASVDGPFHSAFVGIIDGRFVLSSAYESTWTTRRGELIRWSAIEFISFALLQLPDGSVVPDVTQPSIPQTYQTVVGGTGRFRHARGVAFGDGIFEPTAPNVVAATLRSTGYFSTDEGKGKGHQR